ncbi:MAG: alpha-L-glutamate ligase-like protein [Porticoccaceae bacterium]|nr:alpha-L-glutamate ligase-like protein [Porticoccaceae bacterium]HLS98471.1 alpha-L-glutamate ligase-like protein [Porticoccaceae bacterium]
MFWDTIAKFKKKGILGMNARNVAYIARYNERHLFPLVDDKLKTKEAARKHHIKVPDLYGVIRYTAEMNDLGDLLNPLTGFAVKPLRGSGGKGIIIITGRDGEFFLKPSGKAMSLQDIRHDISNILSGVYSLGGRPDTAIIESLIRGRPDMLKYSFEGLPDIRVIVFRGFPVMAMMRCPTHQSDGKANLHQGAVGVGLDICTGRAIRAVQRNVLVDRHPDTGVDFSDLAIPDWDEILMLAAKCYDMTGLGYIGCDFVLDETRGPMILELNARPGLAVQIANGIGLKTRLEAIEALEHFDLHAEERVALIRDKFAATPDAA